MILTVFAIHAGRMQVDWNLVGLLSPAGAVLGDLLIALVLAYGLVAPTLAIWRRLTRPLERRAWKKYLSRVDKGAKGWLGAGMVQRWLLGRMRVSVRASMTRGSVTAALGWGLKVGLPNTVILIAMTPLWGVSWFFDTETWVTGAWEVWAEKRTDSWRTEMVEAVKKAYAGRIPEADFFRLFPDGLSDGRDFSFVVIGDTGEGDASQHILRDQFLLLGQKPEVKFLVVSSDVIYPSGSMKDYEPKFYLPFKGFHKPIYAVPGNHDWYDALEAFTANLCEPTAARAAMRARREADLGLPTTTEARIEGMIQEAARLRNEYQVKAANQRAPYFEIQTDGFALLVVDTGIQRRIDDDQRNWLHSALLRARDKFKMVILGHPLFAAGQYQGANEHDFAAIHQLLRQHAVDIVMAGDTHDFEYYKEAYRADDKSRTMYHFVNGGGGAYLSIGTALSWPKQPPTEECGFYPRADALTTFLDQQTPTWKRPFWYWVREFNAWPSSPEAVASAFEYNRAPFFQSFMEVRVETKANKVRLWLYGSRGRLRWRDLYVHNGAIPDGRNIDDLVEFVFPLSKRRQ